MNGREEEVVFCVYVKFIRNVMSLRLAFFLNCKIFVLNFIWFKTKHVTYRRWVTPRGPLRFVSFYWRQSLLSALSVGFNATVAQLPF